MGKFLVVRAEKKLYPDTILQVTECCVESF